MTAATRNAARWTGSGTTSSIAFSRDPIDGVTAETTVTNPLNSNPTDPNLRARSADPRDDQTRPVARAFGPNVAICSAGASRSDVDPG